MVTDFSWKVLRFSASLTFDHCPFLLASAKGGTNSRTGGEWGAIRMLDPTLAPPLCKDTHHSLNGSAPCKHLGRLPEAAANPATSSGLSLV